MHVIIRKSTARSKENDVLITVSKASTIEDLQKLIQEEMKVDLNKQMLYYRGKLLVPEHRLSDYNINLSDVILLDINTKLPKSEAKTTEDNAALERVEKISVTERESEFYKVGDKIDVIDNDHGAWFEAKILQIFTKGEALSTDIKEDDLIFKITMDRNVFTTPYEVGFSDIRPRSFYVYKVADLECGSIVFVNYNIEEPKKRGYWYDFEIKEMTKKALKGTLLVGKGQAKLEDITLKFIDEIMRIEKPLLLKDRDEEEVTSIPLRKLPLYCLKCKDDPTKKCKDCGCFTCGKKESEGTLILCDECDNAYHLQCLDPPLAEVPSDPEWYCPNCKTDDSAIVKAGEKLKTSKKKMKMASNKEGATSRDWGKGMACVGRTSECTIVPKDHYGPVPGVEVGMRWKYRVQVSESGVHRPHVAGIHGRESDGAYSIVLSGGYEDDVDNGDEFYYTGAGGRDLSGNKRVSGQSCDQQLTRTNKALAVNCNAKFNDAIGAEAKDWKKGKPVRVVRKFKIQAKGKDTPENSAYRYDGIYKVVKYFPEKGKAGFVVWRYLFRRDDPEPAPWEKGGKEFDIVFPPGHLEAEATKTKKRKLNSISNYVKKAKIEPFVLPENLEKLSTQDANNEKRWNDCKELLKEGKQRFLSKVEETFMCVCCQEVLFDPVTLSCKHNVCKSCLKRSFSAEIYVCPCCRFELGAKCEVKVNETLGTMLKELFPGYGAGR